uniref:CP-type G domain-containing protein n=1 Tax=Caenorhabditis japonica TaxID=281687 RepID=A0A8R1DYQ2_CAEJA
MAKYCLKKASKRVSCAKRYKIEKKVRDHNKKAKREAKKNGTGHKKEKTISVPNSCPFKEEILIQAEQEREKVKARQEAAKEAAKNHRIEKRKGNLPANFESMVSKAAKQSAEFDRKAAAAAEQEKFNTLDDKTIKAYASEVRKTIETADVVIQVLDARDPLGSRSKSVEEQVLKGNKRLVLLLNKIDLVPRENVKKWLEYLRGQFPTIAFKASTQEQKSNIGRFNSAILNNTETAKCVGADIVMKILANYCRNKDIKTSIRVGIVGFPNVGKSSVINSLKRRKACNVGNLPGITKEMQEVELDKNIRLIDSPGVILASQKDLDPIEVALKNAIRVDNLLDPIAPVHAILRRCSKETVRFFKSISNGVVCRNVKKEEKRKKKIRRKLMGLFTKPEKIA